MKCPYCNNEMREGMVEVRHAGSLLNTMTMVNWIPDEKSKKKLFRKAVNLSLDAEGYYCEECMKVVAVFDER